jgi:hypothetical protein
MKWIIVGSGIIGIVFLLMTFIYIRDFVKTHGIHVIAGRALAGRKLNGKRHTSATFWRKSDGVTRGHPAGRVGNRHHRAGIANLARTLAWVITGILMIYGAANNLRITVIGTIIAGLIFAGFHTVRIVRKLRDWYTKREYISPLAEAIGPVLELTGPEAEGLISMEPDYLTKKIGTIGRINLPPKFMCTPGQMDTVTHLVTTRLPVGSDLIPQLNGRAPHILIKAAPALPSLVKFSDYIEEIEKLGRGEYFAGIDRKAEGYIAQFKGEEPHHGYCWGTGVGKSTKLMSIIAQIKHNEPDATGTIIDPKEISLECMKGLPGFDFYDDATDFETRLTDVEITKDNWEDFMPGMWEGVRSVYDLMRSRYAQMKEDKTVEFPTHLFIMEEANSFNIMSRTFWQRNKPRGMGAMVPIWADWIAPIFWRARQVNIFVVLVAQSIQERYLGNLNLRPSLGLISLAKYKPAQYQNYIGTTPIPKMQKGKGRALYNDGESDTWVQSPLASESEFRDFAMANCRSRAADLSSDAVASRSQSSAYVITSAPARAGSVPSPRMPADV